MRDRNRVLCGIHAIQEALRVGTRDREHLAAEGGGKASAPGEALAAARDADRNRCESSVDRSCGDNGASSIVAFMASPPLLTFYELTARLYTPEPIPHIVVLDGVKDPRNLGAIIRSAARLHRGVIVPGRVPWALRQQSRSCRWGLEHVGVAEVTNLSQNLERLKRLDFGSWCR